MSFMVVLFIAVTIWNCDQEQTPMLEKGFLEGKITIGPLCPVESNPPNPECQPTEQTYKAWPIIVLTVDTETLVAIIQPDLDGNYTIALAEGPYIVDLENEHLFGKNLPAKIDIIPNKTVTLDINIDTGIR